MVRIRKEIEEKITNLLFDFYFEELSENKIRIKNLDAILEVESINKKSSKQLLLGLLREYVLHLPLSTNYNFLENLEALFTKGELRYDDASSNFLLFASESYGLVLFDGQKYFLNKDIVEVLRKFKHDPKHRDSLKHLPYLKVKSD